MNKVTLDGNKVTMPEGVTLDLGAAGKGIGCDAAKKILDADKNVSGMILNLGGSSVDELWKQTRRLCLAGSCH